MLLGETFVEKRQSKYRNVHTRAVPALAALRFRFMSPTRMRGTPYKYVDDIRTFSIVILQQSIEDV